MRVDLTAIGAARRVERTWERIAEGAVRSVTGEAHDVEVTGIGIEPVGTVRSRFDQTASATVVRIAGERVLLAHHSGNEDEPVRANRAIGDLFLGRLTADTTTDGADPASVRRMPATRALQKYEAEVLTCRVSVPALSLTFQLVLPIAAPVTRIYDPLPVEDVVTVSSSIAAGVAEAGRHASAVRDREIRVTPTAVRFPPRSRIVDDLRAPDCVGFVAGLSEPPGGFLGFTVDRDVGRRLDRELAVHGTVTELGDAVVRGALNAWTNHLFGDAIDCAAPRAVGPGGDAAVVSGHTEWLDERRRYGFRVSGILETEHNDIECDIFVLPNAFPILERFDQIDVSSRRWGETAEQPDPGRNAKKYQS